MPRKSKEEDPRQFDLNRLHHMQRAIKELRTFTHDKTLSDFKNDRKLLLAVVKELEILGEAASRISEAFQTEHSDVPWKEIVAMRNRLIHGYFDIDEMVVWQTIEDDLPPVLKELNRILNAA